MAIQDLSQFTNKYLEVKLPTDEGKELLIKLNKPTERIKTYLLAAIDKQIGLQAKEAKNIEISKNEQIEYLDLIEDLIFQILNNNKDGIEFKRSYINTYFGEFQMITALIAAYKQFLDEVMNHPN